MQQKRFVLALVLSAAILFGWGYLQSRLFPPAPQNNSNASATTAEQQTANTAAAVTQTPASPSPNVQPQQQPASPPQASASDAIPQRKVLIRTPLYDVRLESTGAVATSWIVKKNKDTERALYSVAGDKHNPQPLELINQEGLNQQPRQAPLLLSTGDGNIDALLASRNFKINGLEADAAESIIDLKAGESKRIEFTLHDDATGLDAVKSITFNADRYDTDVEIKLTRGGQPVPQVYLLVGPSIGDQGVRHYSFYSVAPEGIAVAEGKVHRLLGASIHKNEGGWFSSKRPEGADRQIVGGEVDWAGVGDTYFAMLAVPARRTGGLEFRTLKYEHEVGGTKEERYLLTAFVPVPADGSRTELYVGPKDHYLLTSASKEIAQAVGRSVDLEQSIDYGLFSTLSRPLAVPILWSIKRLYELTNSYGVSIIIFTIIIYSLFFPLKWRSSKSMKRAQKLAPRMKELQEKIKGMKQNDPKLKELQMEQLRLMKEGNPLGGCLPLLIQMPFLFALYRAITISIDFRQASFLWIPDLSSAEPYAVHLLPILFAASMIVLQLITPAPSADPLQRKMMAIGMPLFMLYILWSAPAGLLVYWLVGNIVGFSQQILINRLTKSEDDEEPPEEKAGTRVPKKLGGPRVSQA